MAGRNTIQRRLVFEAVSYLGSHPTADEVYAYLHDNHPSISRATVYRNLNQLVENGELVNIGIFGSSNRFDHNRHPHLHLICNHCLSIKDLHGDVSGLVEQISRENAGVEIATLSLSISGICTDCAAKDFS